MEWPDICFNKNQTITHNPDVDGLGVVISFVTTGWLTLLVVLCNYLFVFDSTVSPFRQQETSPLLPRRQPKIDNLTWTSNPLDNLIGRICSKAVGRLTNVMTCIAPTFLVDWFKGLAKKEQTKDAFMKAS
ncbi:hypothetical protein HD806DRAFT_401562 [Xylariaceae sp. AK1471]|nr:hypothetical protein HD806DRAFT_401562 [Xylariaceae sp. AK1471]